MRDGIEEIFENDGGNRVGFLDAVLGGTGNGLDKMIQGAKCSGGMTGESDPAMHRPDGR